MDFALVSVSVLFLLLMLGLDEIVVALKLFDELTMSL